MDLNGDSDVLYECKLGNIGKIQVYGDYVYFGEDGDLNRENIKRININNIEDIAMIAIKYNVTNEDNLWDETLDINNDNIIDIYDLVLIFKKL